jgi:hypothetical protein
MGDFLEDEEGGRGAGPSLTTEARSENDIMKANCVEKCIPENSENKDSRPEPTPSPDLCTMTQSPDFSPSFVQFIKSSSQGLLSDSGQGNDKKYFKVENDGLEAKDVEVHSVEEPFEVDT